MDTCWDGVQPSHCEDGRSGWESTPFTDPGRQGSPTVSLNSLRARVRHGWESWTLYLMACVSEDLRTGVPWN